MMTQRDAGRPEPTTSSRSSAPSPNGPQAGYPQITIPMGYNATQRRTLNVSVHGNAYDERDLIGVAYVIEQATQAAPAGQHGQPEHVPLREDRPGAAVRRARRAATRTTTSIDEAASAARADAAVLAGDRVGEEPAGPA